MSENPEMIFPIKKRINTEMLIGSKHRIYIKKMVQETFWLNLSG